MRSLYKDKAGSALNAFLDLENIIVPIRLEQPVKYGQKPLFDQSD